MSVQQAPSALGFQAGNDMRKATLHDKPYLGDSDAGMLSYSLNGIEEDWACLSVVALEGEGCAKFQSGNPQAIIADCEDKKHGRELRLLIKSPHV